MPGHTKKAEFKAFGWTLLQMAMPVGGQYAFLVTKDTPKSEMPARALWTKGRVTGFNKSLNEPIAERTRGTFTGAPGIAHKGRIVLTAQEDSEWFCIPHQLNKSQAAELTVLSVNSGEVKILEAGTKLFICDGVLTIQGKDYTTGDSVEVTEEELVSPSTDVLGLIFAESLT